MLAALLRKLGCDVVDISSVADDPKQIADAIQRGMAYDALFIAGGMSMGEYDYVPRLLVELGVEMKITKLRIKPGKPFVFGARGRDEGTEGQRDRGAEGNSLRPLVPSSLSPFSTFIFGLPGNPVSAFVCTLRLASRLLTRIAGGEVEERWTTGRLTAGVPANGPREFYQPAICKILPGRHSGQSGFASITPLQWKGSADLFTLASANVLIVRAENEPAIPSGSIVRVLEM
jgi:molybdopterin molybdotransferase